MSRSIIDAKYDDDSPIYCVDFPNYCPTSPSDCADYSITFTKRKRDDKEEENDAPAASAEDGEITKDDQPPSPKRIKENEKEDAVLLQVSDVGELLSSCDTAQFLISHDQLNNLNEYKKHWRHFTPTETGKWKDQEQFDFWYDIWDILFAEIDNSLEFDATDDLPYPFTWAFHENNKPFPNIDNFKISHTISFSLEFPPSFCF